MALSCVVSEIFNVENIATSKSQSRANQGGGFSRKSQNFATPCIVCPAEGEFGSGVPGQKLEWRGYRVEKEVWRYLQPSGYNAPTWQTDGQTDRQTLSDSKDRAYA